MGGMLFISCIRFSIQLLMVEAFFVLGWTRKRNFLPRILIAIVTYFFAAFILFKAFTSIPGNSPIVSAMYYIGLFSLTLGVLRGCFQVKGKELMFAGVCAYATQHMAFAVSMMIQELSGIKLSTIPDFIWFRFLPYLIVGLLMYLLLIRKYEGKGELKDKDTKMIFVSFVILLTVVFLSVFVDSKLFRGQSGILINVLCKLYAIVCCALAIFVAFNLSQQNRILREKEMMEDMLHSLKEQQKLSRENINIINIKCHDLKYRLSRISRIENESEQEEYIESIKEAIAIYDNSYQTGNDVLDLVLTEKSLLCEEYHIKLSCMIEGESVKFINTTDLYALFGNLLDNAIESVMKEVDEEKRIISILLTQKAQGCYIHIDNYCNEKLVFEDGLPLTTKENKEYHGFGVRSIKYIVEKYQGDILMQATENHFYVDILFL